FIAWPAPVNAKKTQLITEFIKWTQTFPDVWYVTNTQLIQWILNPVPAANMASFLPCNAPKVDASQPEICDGLDNKGTGQPDSGLVLTCGFPDSSFQSCFGCPDTVPIPASPLGSKPLSGNRLPIPVDGCLSNSIWDPVGGKCVDGMKMGVAAPKIISNLNNGSLAIGTNVKNTTVNSNSDGQKSGAVGIRGGMMKMLSAVGVVLGLM
ncbi:hypothetical protein HDU76_012088, partial [Blyttiomyces sp. JEL0837]